MNLLMTVGDAVVQWLGFGLLDASVWQIVVYTLVVTHFTILGVTIFLHRAQAHRALELGLIPSTASTTLNAKPRKTRTVRKHAA